MNSAFTYTPVVLVALCAFVLGQAPAPEEAPAKGQKKAVESAPPREEMPRSLDDMIAVALRSNPDVLRAEAKVVQARMALNQTRLRITEEIVSTNHERQRLEGMLRFAENSLSSMQRAKDVNTVSILEVLQAETALIDAKAKLEQNQARLRFLLGLGGDKSLRATSGPAALEPARGAGRERPDFSPRQKEMLERKVRIEGPTIKVKELLEKTTGEMVVAPSPYDALEVLAPKAKEAEVPLRVLLNLLADAQNRQIAFLFRDYGILITSEEVAKRTLAPAIPEETPLQVD